MTHLEKEALKAIRVLHHKLARVVVAEGLPLSWAEIACQMTERSIRLQREEDERELDVLGDDLWG